MAEDAPVPRLANAILLGAIKRGARVIELRGRRVRLWIADAWHDELVLPPGLDEAIARRFGVMIGALAPANGRSIAGSFRLEIEGKGPVAALVEVARVAGAFEVAIELVPPAELGARERPWRPAES